MTQAISFVEAKRSESRLRLAIMGPAGAGKTYSLLLVLYGIIGDWSKIFVICTERGSAALYEHLCGKGPKFRIFIMEAPFSPERYRQAIQAAQAAGALGIIVDGLSQAWEGEGGALDRVDAAAQRSGNSYTAWKDVTPEHRSMVDAILQSPCHIAVTMRAKQEYVLEANDKGKMVPKRVGLAPVQRAGMEYEFTLFIDIDESHYATASKDRTGLFDQKRFKPSAETGIMLKKWLESGSVPAAPVAAPAAAPAKAANFELGPPDFEPGSIQHAVNLTNEFKARVDAVTTRAQGSALWTAINEARNVIGDESMTSLLATLKSKAPTLTAE